MEQQQRNMRQVLLAHLCPCLQPSTLINVSEWLSGDTAQSGLADSV